MSFGRDQGESERGRKLASPFSEDSVAFVQDRQFWYSRNRSGVTAQSRLRLPACDSELSAGRLKRQQTAPQEIEMVAARKYLLEEFRLESIAK